MSPLSEKRRAWDLVVVGAGPAGSAAALGALSADPRLRVLLVDRADFPRDKACGDGIAPHVLDVLAGVGVTGLLDDWNPVRRLQLRLSGSEVSRTMVRPTWVVPRAVFDARLVAAAVRAGAQLQRHRIRDVAVGADGVVVDDDLTTAVLVGADGAHSVVRRVAGLPEPERRALALRAYQPTRPEGAGRQVIVFGTRRQPSYAWSFDRGDGWSNVGYGELLDDSRSPSRQELLDRLEQLLPGATAGLTEVRGHHLPLSSWTHEQPDGRVLLAGDAASLVNPMTGEGIFYAVATGVLAGQAAARALGAERPAAAGALHRRAVRRLLARHLRHTAALAHLVGQRAVVTAGIRAAARDGGVFDDLVEIGLGRGLLTGRILRGLAAEGLRSLRPRSGARLAWDW